MVVRFDRQWVPHHVEGVQRRIQDVVFEAVHPREIHGVQGRVGVVQLQDRIPERVRLVEGAPSRELIHFRAGDLADDLARVRKGLEVHGQEHHDLAAFHPLERLRECVEHLEGIAGVDFRTDGALEGPRDDPANVGQRLFLAGIELLKNPDGVGELQNHGFVAVHHVLGHEFLEAPLGAPQVHGVGAATVEDDHEPAGRRVAGVGRLDFRRRGRGIVRDSFPELIAFPVHDIEARYPLLLSVLEQCEVPGAEPGNGVPVAVEHEYVHDDPGGGGAEAEGLARRRGGPDDGREDDQPAGESLASEGLHRVGFPEHGQSARGPIPGRSSAPAARCSRCIPGPGPAGLRILSRRPPFLQHAARTSGGPRPGGGLRCSRAAAGTRWRGRSRARRLQPPSRKGCRPPYGARRFGHGFHGRWRKRPGTGSTRRVRPSGCATRGQLGTT